MKPDEACPEPVSTPLFGSEPMEEAVCHLASWRDWEAIAADEHHRSMQRLVTGLFREELMGGLALVLIPILLLIDFGNLSPTATSFLYLLDISIWVFFVLEYVCRLWVAPDRTAFVKAPWNVLDLLIVGVPALALLAGTGYGFARYLRVLRVMQAFQVLKVGAKTAKMEMEKLSPREAARVARPVMAIRSLPIAGPSGSSQTPVWSDIVLSDRAGILPHDGLWIDISGFTDEDIRGLATITQVPDYALRVKLRERAFPRAESDGNTITVFLQIPSVVRTRKEFDTYEIQWKGLLVGFDRDSVMTFSRTRPPVLDKIVSGAPAEGIRLNGPGVLYLAINSSLDAVEDIILSAEEQLLYLEIQPMHKLPRNFLAMMYADQKEIGRINSGLLHTKNAIEVICSSDPAVFRITAEEIGRLRALADRCSLLSESTQHLSNSFAWMVDFYLNTNSFSMNRVMKILAALTALTMVPAIVGGLLGMNLVGNPWPATLLQTVTIVALVMILMAWLYYNLGWLKR